MPCLCQGLQTFQNCMNLCWPSSNICWCAWDLIPHWRLCEFVKGTLHLLHGSELRLISGDWCFWKLLGQSATEGTPSLFAFRIWAINLGRSMQQSKEGLHSLNGWGVILVAVVTRGGLDPWRPSYICTRIFASKVSLLYWRGHKSTH